MRKILLILLLSFLAYPSFAAEKSSASTASQVVASKECDSKSTQADLDECARQNAHSAKEVLAQQLSELKKRYADNPEKIKEIEKAQKAWESFVKAQIDLLYNDHTGSAEPMCAANTLERLTWQRVEQLKEWMNIEEGDVCGGL